ncbi:MAG: class I SAM-dependent methyltransferase [Proteobacteria bacterium]|nr:class I SAM-dependent methyltransferase [Pseudomonadota bacterium]
MSQADVKFAGSIPALYEQTLVPLIFAPYADDTAARIAALAPKRILETAAGTGALTRALVRALPAASLTATDLNPAMIAEAQRRLPDGPRLAWRQADALALPFADASFDCVACQFGVMFFPDRVKGMAEARRLLAPGGSYVFAVWDSLATNPVVAEIDAALRSHYPVNPPDFIGRIPHGYHDPVRIEADVRRAGFAEVEIETITHVARAPSAQAAAEAWCQGTPIRSEIEARGGPLAAVTARVAEALARNHGPGPVESPIQAIIVTARG